MRAGTIQSVNGAGIGPVVTSVNGKGGPVTVAAAAGVTSVDGDAGPAVDLTDNYLGLGGGTLVGPLVGTAATMTTSVTTPTVIVSGSVRVGAAPASSGDVRLSNLGQITFRAASGLSDVLMFNGDANNNTVSGTNLIPSGDGVRSLGLTSNRWTVMHSLGAQINANGSPGAVERFRVNNPTTSDAIACTILSSDGFTRRPLVLQGAGLQTGELLHGQDSTGAQMFAFLSNGHLVSPTLRVGTTPATSGLIRLPSGSGITSRNNAGSADVNVIYLNASDQAELPSTVPASDNTRALGTTTRRWAQVNAAKVQIASTGTLGTVEQFRAGANPTTVDNTANALLVASGPAAKPLVIQADPAQAAPLLDIQDSAGGSLFSVGSAGAVASASLSATYLTQASVDGSTLELNAGTLREKDAGTTNAKLANMANKTFKGRHTAGTGVPEDVSAANVMADLSGAAGAAFSLNSQKITSLLDGTATTDAAALRQAMFAEVAVPLISTYYVRSPAQLSTTTGTPTLNLMQCVPIVFANAGTLVSIAAANNANTASAVCRLGLYADNGSGQPGALIDDYGTVDFSTGPTTKTITISRAVTAMTLYWLAAVEQGAATSAKVAANGSGSGLTPGYTTPLNSTIPTQCWTQASVSGGLPNPAVVTATGTSSIIVEVKV